MKNRFFLFLTALVFCILTACRGGETRPIIDYGDAESFEAALNAGENLEGKIVSFEAKELKPQSAMGYNIWAGEHLNFISSRNPDIKIGDYVTVKVTSIESMLGSWFIKYEKIDAVKGDSTIYSGSSSSGKASDASSVSSAQASEDIRPLELKEYGLYIDPSYYGRETAFVEFCGIIHNPNENHVAEYPHFTITVKNPDGSILATETQTGSTVQPGDTVTLCGMFQLSLADTSDDAEIYYNLDCSGFSKSSGGIRTTDLPVTNVSERSGSDRSYITGEVSNYSSTETMVNLSLILRKDGEIVYIENTFTDHLQPGTTAAFQFDRHSPYPDHDTIEVTGQEW